MSLSEEMYDGASGKSSLLRSGPLDRRQGNAATARTTLLHSCATITRSVARVSEQARAEACRRLAGRWGPGRRPTFCCARLSDGTLSCTGPRDSGMLRLVVVKRPLLVTGLAARSTVPSLLRLQPTASS